MSAPCPLTSRGFRIKWKRPSGRLFRPGLNLLVCGDSPNKFRASYSSARASPQGSVAHRAARLLSQAGVCPHTKNPGSAVPIASWAVRYDGDRAPAESPMAGVRPPVKMASGGTRQRKRRAADRPRTPEYAGRSSDLDLSRIEGQDSRQGGIS